MPLILKNRMQKTDTIIGEHQSEAIKNRINYCNTLCDITNESTKLNKDLSVISLGLILSFLFCKSSETNSFT